jgi:hypothetical protein
MEYFVAKVYRQSAVDLHRSSSIILRWFLIVQKPTLHEIRTNCTLSISNTKYSPTITIFLYYSLVPCLPVLFPKNSVFLTR